jgi:hypothetical protein
MACTSGIFRPDQPDHPDYYLYYQTQFSAEVCFQHLCLDQKFEVQKEETSAEQIEKYSLVLVPGSDPDGRCCHFGAALHGV